MVAGTSLGNRVTGPGLYRAAAVRAHISCHQQSAERRSVTGAWAVAWARASTVTMRLVLGCLLSVTVLLYVALDHSREAARRAGRYRRLAELRRLVFPARGDGDRIRASNEPSRRLKFYNHGEGPCLYLGGLVSIDS